MLEEADFKPLPEIYSARQLATLRLDHSRSVDDLHPRDQRGLRAEAEREWETTEVMGLPAIAVRCSEMSMPEARKTHQCEVCRQVAAVAGELYIRVGSGAFSDGPKLCLFCAWSLYGVDAYKHRLLPDTKWTSLWAHRGPCGRGCLLDESSETLAEVRKQSGRDALEGLARGKARDRG